MFTILLIIISATLFGILSFRGPRENLLVLGFFRLVAYIFILPAYLFGQVFYADFHGLCSGSFFDEFSCTFRFIVALIILVPALIFYILFDALLRDDIKKLSKTENNDENNYDEECEKITKDDIKKIKKHYNWSRKIALIPLVFIFAFFISKIIFIIF